MNEKRYRDYVEGKEIPNLIKTLRAENSKMKSSWIELKQRMNKSMATDSIDVLMENVGKPWAEYKGNFISAILIIVDKWMKEIEEKKEFPKYGLSIDWIEEKLDSMKKEITSIINRSTKSDEKVAQTIIDVIKFEFRRIYEITLSFTKSGLKKLYEKNNKLEKE